jgi:hypothetical protein
MEQLSFSIPEILSLIGLTQCVYVLVYMLFRAGDRRRALLPFAYFLVLGVAFLLDFAARFIGDMTVYYPILQWFFWFFGPPLSVLLMIQIARIQKAPDMSNFWVIFLTPFAYGAAVSLSLRDDSCIFPSGCAVLYDWLVITGLMAGAVSMLAMWGQRGLLEELGREKSGQERYWLILMLVFMK